VLRRRFRSPLLISAPALEQRDLGLAVLMESLHVLHRLVVAAVVVEVAIVAVVAVEGGRKGGRGVY